MSGLGAGRGGLGPCEPGYDRSSCCTRRTDRYRRLGTGFKKRISRLSIAKDEGTRDSGFPLVMLMLAPITNVHCAPLSPSGQLDSE
jgi:hypothetical protein